MSIAASLRVRLRAREGFLADFGVRRIGRIYSEIKHLIFSARKLAIFLRYNAGGRSEAVHLPVPRVVPLRRKYGNFDETRKGPRRSSSAR